MHANTSLYILAFKEEHLIKIGVTSRDDGARLLALGPPERFDFPGSFRVRARKPCLIPRFELELKQLFTKYRCAPEPLLKSGNAEVFSASILPDMLELLTAFQESEPAAGVVIERDLSEWVAGADRPTSFWITPEDRAILHEISAMLYAQGLKPSDNLIVRAGLRFLPRDHRFMETVQQLVNQDKRRVRHQRPVE